jgi:copper(I)-binding protein
MTTLCSRIAALGTLLLATQAWSQVTATAPWVRATVPGQPTAGAYMTLRSAQDAALVGAESAAAHVVEIHEMRMDGDVMRMRAVRSLALPAGKDVELKPAGFHIMLVDIKQQLKKGDVVPIRLKVQGKDKKTVTVNIRAEVRDTPPAAAKGMDEHMH